MAEMLSTAGQLFTVRSFETKMPVRTLLAQYFDPELTLQGCRTCPNYGQSWSCPEFDFSMREYWEKYETVEIMVEQFLLSDAVRESAPGSAEQRKLREELPGKLAELRSSAVSREKEHPGGVSFTPGGMCENCKGGCTKPQGLPCRFPDSLRHSVEALGINVVKLMEQEFGITIRWGMNGKLPEYYTFVVGIMYNENGG